MIVTDEGEVIQGPRSALRELRACFKKSNEHHLVTLKTLNRRASLISD